MAGNHFCGKDSANIASEKGDVATTKYHPFWNGLASLYRSQCAHNFSNCFSRAEVLSKFEFEGK